jgi:hypothetical protein
MPATSAVARSRGKARRVPRVMPVARTALAVARRRAGPLSAAGCGLPALRGPPGRGRLVTRYQVALPGRVAGSAVAATRRRAPSGPDQPKVASAAHQVSACPSRKARPELVDLAVRPWLTSQLTTRSESAFRVPASAKESLPRSHRVAGPRPRPAVAGGSRSGNQKPRQRAADLKASHGGRPYI